MDLSKLKRALVISDTHFGIRNSSYEWLDISKNYFYDFLIPIIKKNYKDGDFLIHCGDMFDSRSALNLFTMNSALEIFEKLAEILPIIIILGNHDIANHKSNEINSVKVLKWVPNIKVIEEPEVLEIANHKLLFMSWRSSKQEEIKCINDNPADFLFCHTDFKGIKFNRSTEVEEGLDLKKLRNFKKIYSGHIHYSQNKGNFRMLGCPYSLTRSDIGNEKAVWLYDFENDIETKFVNDYSPKFLRLQFEAILEMSMEELTNLVKNNFVDIIVDSKWYLNFPFSTFSEELKGFRKLEFVNKFAEDSIDGENYDEKETEVLDILQLANSVVSQTKHSDNVKEKMLLTIKKLYEEAQFKNKNGNREQEQLA